MDGILLDARGRLTLTPLNMTLGIFNVTTRKRQEAWETIYYHPDHSYVSPNHQKKKNRVNTQRYEFAQWTLCSIENL